jgi:hypothetical protein
MVQESDLVPFADWIWPALVYYVQIAAILGLAALVVGFLVAAFRYGPSAGADRTFHLVRTCLRDLASLSPRRISALAWLAVQESLRRRVLVGFAVFLLILLFTGWFLDTKSNDPAKLYLSFVLTATTWLVLLMALFLSALSLPADIKNRTIYTIVTKPVRAGEIVLGRVVGFAVIGTLMLSIMGLFSYVFVARALNHTHEVDVASLKNVPNDSRGSRSGRTTLVLNHRHQLTLDVDGNGATDVVQGHYHNVTAHTQGDKVTYVVGPPEDMFTARVPIYATALRFKDRSGKGSDRGINVGNEWKYRSYIEGGSLAAATWTFADITPEQFPNGLPIEMTIRVFRSYKGDIEKGILGSLVLRNPKTGRASQIETFRAKDFYIDHRDIPRKLTDPSGKNIDLFDDLVADGQLEIELQCLDNTQFFGVAKPDIYLRARDAAFTMNFIKSYLAIWVQMLLVTGLGVMFSTFLSGAVAMLATLAALVMGFFKQFVVDVASGAVQGGGPIESFIRLIKQQNVTMDMEPGLTTDVVKAGDTVFMGFMTRVTNLLPDFRNFDSANYVANGFDIPPDTVLIQTFTVLGYVAGVFVVGYFFLRIREVAR